MKKKYMKPSMMVYDLKNPTRLLAGSDPNAPGYPGGPFGFVPGDDEKKLA